MKLQPSIVDVLRFVAGKICETFWMLNTDGKTKNQSWHFFTGSPFGFRWESREKREQRLLSYSGRDRESIRISEKLAAVRDKIANAKAVREARGAGVDAWQE